MAEENTYLVSARKYRPSTFKDVVGQKSLSTTLKNAIDKGRLAQAYLFCGPRGVGKTSCARIFAKTINCQNPDPDGDACGCCPSCEAIQKGNSFDLVELDAASNNSVDDIRSITEQVNVPPQNGRYRVFIIDEVHMLSSSAFNAFLKTLEEPPANVVFILATTEKHKVIPTILSRCQIYDFKRITVEDIVDHLEYVASREGIKTEREALGIIALKADGAMRDALSIFDQLSAATGGDITYSNTLANLNVLDYEYYFRLIDAFRDGDVADALLLYKEIRERGFDSLFFVNGLASHIRDLMVAYDAKTMPLLDAPGEVGKKFNEQAVKLPVKWYYEALKILNDCDLNYRIASDKRLLVELSLIRLCQLLQKESGPFEVPDGKKPLRNPAKKENAASDKLEEETSQTPDPSVSGPYKPDPLPGTPKQKESGNTGEEKKPHRPRSFSLKETSANNVKASSIDENRRKEISEDSFKEAWNIFISRNPAMHILVNAMRASSPSKRGEEEFKITVDHPAQVQAFESAMPILLKFLRDKLENDYLSLKIELNEEKDESKKHLPPKEFLKKIISENPYMGDFLKNIEAEMI